MSYFKHDSDTPYTDGHGVDKSVENTERMNKIMFEASVRLKSDLKQIKSDDKGEYSDTWSVDYKQAENLIPNSLYNLVAFILNENIDISDKVIESGRVKLQENAENSSGSSISIK